MEEMNQQKVFAVKKGSILLHKGDMCNYGYKVIKGCLRSYVIDGSGKEHIIQFAPEEWFISDMDSFFNNTPSRIFIDAIEPTEFIKFDSTSFEALRMVENEQLKEPTTRLIRNIIASNKRIIGLLSSSAEERYVEFIQTYPTLNKRLPLKLIASYLGMTPEYLSDVRKKIAKK
jgi:CRP-like cAMP-binding protein